MPTKTMTNEKTKNTKKIPMRRCAGCMESKPQKELIRIVGHEGKVAVDLTGRAKGRGVYLCQSEECYAKAVKKKGISRSLKIEISSERMNELMEELRENAGKNP